ncbi:hypothetical protein JYK22_10835, partial [Nonomuraea sp. RK-328]|nr:hypothetical protein [Nonomuraea sp. RK-328]
VLEVDYPAGLDRQIHLRGRGLTVIPSYYHRGNPVALADPVLPPVLVYPLPRRTTATAAVTAAAGDEALAALLGRTRAAILSCVAHAPGSSTGGTGADRVKLIVGNGTDGPCITVPYGSTGSSTLQRPDLWPATPYYDGWRRC